MERVGWKEIKNKIVQVGVQQRWRFCTGFLWRYIGRKGGTQRQLLTSFSLYLLKDVLLEELLGKEVSLMGSVGRAGRLEANKQSLGPGDKAQRAEVLVATGRILPAAEDTKLQSSWCL